MQRQGGVQLWPDDDEPGATALWNAVTLPRVYGGVYGGRRTAEGWLNTHAVTAEIQRTRLQYG
jgi:hypothetical protein